MDANPRARTWRVTLPDRSATEVAAMKLVVTNSGALMFVDFDREPRQVFREWASCEELTKGGRR